MYNIDIEVGRDADLESVIEIIRRVLRQRKVPKTTVIKQCEPGSQGVFNLLMIW